MKVALAHSAIAAYFTSACHDELNALKPGNVHIHAPGHDMDVSHFKAAAAAAAPQISKPNTKVGTRILHAVTASFEAAKCNTNLGIILLCAPLAAAAEMISTETDLNLRLEGVLSALDIDDATQAYEAIAHANPAGLGKAHSEDVHAPPSQSLKEAMALAANRDRIANAYVTNFSDIFDTGLPTLNAASGAANKANVDPHFAVTTLHMHYLSKYRDSHIARKHGEATAQLVKTEAESLRASWSPIATLSSFDALMEFDTSLKQRKLNPGTTADFVVATLFAAHLQQDLAKTANENPTIRQRI